MIRHSALPKLAECPCYESASGEQSPAASRGTLIDSVVRQMLAGNEQAIAVLKEDKDRAAALWSVQEICSIAGGAAVETDEKKLKVKTPLIDHEGTEDARASSIKASFDLKTGNIYDYEAQAAAYSWGNMEREFEEEWTFHLIFADQRQVVTHHFTRDRAREIVTGILDRVNDPNKKPTGCQYCNWCRNRNHCPQVVQPCVDTKNLIAASDVTIESLRRELAADPNKLGRFLKQAKVFKSQLWDWASEEAKTLLQSGTAVDGWRISKVKESEIFDAAVIAEAAQDTEATYLDVITLMGGEVSGKEFRPWAEARGYNIQGNQARVKAGYDRLIESKK